MLLIDVRASGQTRPRRIPALLRRGTARVRPEPSLQGRLSKYFFIVLVGQEGQNVTGITEPLCKTISLRKLLNQVAYVGLGGSFPGSRRIGNAHPCYLQ